MIQKKRYGELQEIEVTLDVGDIIAMLVATKQVPEGFVLHDHDGTYTLTLRRAELKPDSASGATK